MEMDKTALIDILIQKVTKELAVTIAAARSAHEAATHEELVAENKYDTKGLEASYLAGAQARRANELQLDLDSLGKFKEEIHIENRTGIGQIFEIESEQGDRDLLFLAPCQGGSFLDFGGRMITVITPSSPVGKSLLGKKDEDEIKRSKNQVESYWTILKVF